MALAVVGAIASRRRPSTSKMSESTDCRELYDRRFQRV